MRSTCQRAADFTVRCGYNKEGVILRAMRIVRRASPMMAVLTFLTIIAVWAFRTVSVLNIPGQPEISHRWGMGDFREAVYYPVRAMLDGDNPYDVNRMLEVYPVDLGIFVYSPSALLFNLPFGILPYGLSQLAYFAISAAMIPALALLLLRCVGIAVTAARVFWLAAFIAAGRPVYSALTLGQGSLFMVFGTIVALHFARSRPNLAGVGIAVAAVKPTFGLPLVLLMFVRGDFRALKFGIVFGILTALIPTLVLAASAGGFAELAAGLQDGIHQELQSPNNSLVDSGWMHVNASIALVRLLGVPPFRELGLIVALAGLGLAALALRKYVRFRHEPSGQDLSSIIMSVAILVTVHHYIYDATLVILPLVVFFASRQTPWNDLMLPFRYGLGTLLVVLWFNFLATDLGLRAAGLSAGSSGWNIATSINSAILLTVFGALVWLAFGPRSVRHHGSGHSDHNLEVRRK